MCKCYHLTAVGNAAEILLAYDNTPQRLTSFVAGANIQIAIASANNTAASAAKSLRVKVLLDEVPKTYIASKVGLSRMTVGKHLKSDASVQ